jgi:hypothetical protein
MHHVEWVTALGSDYNPWIPVVQENYDTFVYAEGGATTNLERLNQHNGANVFVRELGMMMYFLLSHAHTHKKIK